MKSHSEVVRERLLKARLGFGDQTSTGRLFYEAAKTIRSLQLEVNRLAGRNVYPSPELKSAPLGSLVIAKVRDDGELIELGEVMR